MTQEHNDSHLATGALFRAHLQQRKTEEKSQGDQSKPTTGEASQGGNRARTFQPKPNNAPSCSVDSNNQKQSEDQNNSKTGRIVESVPDTDIASTQRSPKQNVPLPGKSSSTSIIVSGRQRGNPILKFIRNVSWEYGDIVADYQMGKATCALFLSLRYHALNPSYIHERLKRLGHSYDLRVLLVHIDVKDPHHSLKELAQICLLSDTTLILAFTAEEAGRYLETYKAYENKPPDLIMEKTESNFLAQFTDCITSTRKVNKTDAVTLLTTFGSFADIAKQSEEDLSLCPGFGPNKAKGLHDLFHEPFLKAAKKSKPSKTGDGDPKPGTSNSS